MAITIIGLPWSFAALRIALYTLLPFGHEMRTRPDAGVLSTLGNIVWFVLAGWWLALGHLILAVGLAITSAFPSPGRTSSWRVPASPRSARRLCRAAARRG
jgi:uncharacterized membrane protein YccF (DUF307 family)